MTTAPKDFRRAFEPKKYDLASLFDKQPPHALEAECALLGSLLLDWQVVGEVLQIIRSPEDFYLSKHAAIYKAAVELYDQHQSLDIVQLVQRLKDVGQLEAVGGVDYLVELGESVPSATSAAYYANLVRQKAVLRHLIDAAGQILERAYTSGEPVDDQLNIAEQEIFRLAEGGSSEDAAELRQLLQETYERLEAHDGRSITGLETGFFELDEMTNGLQNGEMIIVAARPSMGKTALALNIAEHIAATNKRPVGVFSLEMGRQQLAQRLLCSRSGVDSQRVRRNMLTGDEFARLAMVVGELSEAPLYIDDTPGLTLLSLRAKARRMASRHDVEAIVSRGIKGLARELNVPVICLSQLNRAAEGREGHRPRMSDLRESGSIEQDADVVMMLHREDYYHRGEEGYEETNIAELIIAKQRNGPTGVVKLQFNGQTTRFNNLAHGSDGGY